MYLSDLLKYGEYESACSPASVIFTEITSDTRKAADGCLFVALPGRRHDALSMLSASGIRPAAVILKENEAFPSALLGIPAFFVPSPHKTLAYLYSRFYGSPEKHLTVIGVTGTAGKSSTSEILYHILRENGIHTGLIGTVHCLADDVPCEDGDCLTMTTPEPASLYKMLAAMRDRGVTHVVMEVSSQALDQARTAPIHFAVAVFTNLSPEHLDYHGSMENYFLAKARLFAVADTAVLNVDDPAGRRMALYARGKVVRVGILEKGDYNAVDLSFGRRADYTVLSSDMAFPVSVPLPGAFSVYNSLLAAVAALMLDIPPAVIHKALSGMGMIRGRMETIDTDYGFSVMIDYAHTEEALRSLLRAARPLTEKRLILLFGCGGDRDRHKRAAMGHIAEKNADLTILTADNSRSENTETIIGEILGGITDKSKTIAIPSRKDAIEYALSIAEKGDLVLLVGKGHETYEITQDGIRDFDERNIVHDYFAHRNEEKT